MVGGYVVTADLTIQQRLNRGLGGLRLCHLLSLTNSSYAYMQSLY